MTIDAGSLLSVSIGTLVVLLGTVVSAAVTWTRLTSRLDALSRELRGLRSWQHEQVSSLRLQLDESRSKHHTLADQVQEHEVRLAAHGLHAARAPGVPRRVLRDPTPAPIEPPRRYTPGDPGHEDR